MRACVQNNNKQEKEHIAMSRTLIVQFGTSRFLQAHADMFLAKAAH